MDLTRKLLIVLALVFVVFNTARAGRCQSVNLYEDGNNPLHQIEIVDQKDVAACYAHTAAQMMSYHIKERYDSDFEAHGLYIALVHKLKRKIHWTPNKLDYSLLQWAVQDYEKLGHCSNDNYKSSMKRAKLGNPINDSDLVDFMRNVFKRYHKYRRKRKTRKGALARAYKEVSSQAYFQSMVPNSLLSSFQKMKNYSRRKFLKYLNREVFKACSQTTNIASMVPEMVHNGRGFQSNHTIMRIIQNALDHPDPQPVGLGYCSNILRDEPGKHRMMKRPRLLNMVLKAGKCSAHYSVVVAQKNFGDRCAFLIRNSYGKKNWDQGRTCYCKFKDGAQGDCRKEQDSSVSEVLGCWIDGEELAANTFDMSTFIK
jgi:hypothetical protein